LRQVTAQRDHGIVAIQKLEADHKSAAEEAVHFCKETRRLEKELKNIQGEIASNKEARKLLVGEAVDLRERMLKAQADRERALLDMEKMKGVMKERDELIQMMQHREKMWQEEKEEEVARIKVIDGDNKMHKTTIDRLNNEVAMLTEKRAKLEGSLAATVAEKRELQGEKARLEAELENATERLSIAQELKHIDLGQFNAMRQTNLEVAHKIERFLDATKDKALYEKPKLKRMDGEYDELEKTAQRS